MEFKLVILSVACFSCLIPSAVSINLLAAKAVAGETAQDIAAIGAKTLAAKKEAVMKAAADIASVATQGVALKGQAIKTAAASMAGAMINGVASIGATLAKAGLKMVAAKFSGLPTIVAPTPVLQDAVVEETIVEEPAIVELDEAVEVPVQVPSMSEVSVEVQRPFFELPVPPQLSPVWTTVEEVSPSFEIVGPVDPPFVYEIVETPQVFGPLIDTFQFGK